MSLRLEQLCILWFLNIKLIVRKSSSHRFIPGVHCQLQRLALSLCGHFYWYNWPVRHILVILSWIFGNKSFYPRISLFVLVYLGNGQSIWLLYGIRGLLHVSRAKSSNFCFCPETQEGSSILFSAFPVNWTHTSYVMWVCPISTGLHFIIVSRTRTLWSLRLRRRGKRSWNKYWRKENNPLLFAENDKHWKQFMRKGRLKKIVKQTWHFHILVVNTPPP